MLLRIMRVACATCILISVGIHPMIANAQTATSATSAKKSLKKKKTVRPGSQPATRSEVNDRSVIPEKHDARHGY